MVEPINELDVLWSWKEKKNVNAELRHPIKNYRKKDGPEILLCHDMKGGYLPEESEEGITFDPNQQPYIFLNWWHIDIFCYFSHNFITIPPFSYTKLAHEHGCLSLGTFITEWKPGAARCSKFLDSPEKIEDTVVALVNIAEYHGFDGWLINIENVLKCEEVDNMIEFVRLLTVRSRSINPNSRVIWYDSVLHNGRLHWQNALNDKNVNFYNACDGIYLNYNWTDEMLLDSADFGKLNKIFVGIDVFARGCLGGFDTWKSMSRIHLLRMSTAIFAPGWICEKFPDKDQVEMGIRFWTMLLPYAPPRRLKSAELETDFSFGVKIHENEKRFNLSSISLQPQCLSNKCYPTLEGLLFSEPGSFTIFNFDCHVEELSVEFHHDDYLTVKVNEEIYNDNSDELQSGKGISTLRIKKPLDLISIDVITYKPNVILKRLKISHNK